VPPAEFETMREAFYPIKAPRAKCGRVMRLPAGWRSIPTCLRPVPALRALLARQELVALFHYVASFRTTPLHYVQTIVRQVETNEADPQERLHADSFHSSLKAWLFLNLWPRRRAVNLRARFAPLYARTARLGAPPQLSRPARDRPGFRREARRECPARISSPMGCGDQRH
jgi:hypothetical protein